MKFRLLAIVLPALVWLASIAAPANADLITFGNANLFRSTVEGFQEITAPSGVPASSMPADSTFTQPFNGVLPDGNSGVWYRFNFALPAGFSGVSMNIQLSVDNEVQVFLNDQNAAVEDDTVVQNFSPPFPQFTLNSNGTVTNNSGTWDALPITQSMFQTGPNELTFFATNNGGPGHFNLISGSIEFAANGVVPVPEPSSALLLGLGLLGMLGYGWRRRATPSTGC